MISYIASKLCPHAHADCNVAKPCRTLQRQEEAREAALKAFHDNIAARATAAGAIAVAENKARQEREDRLISASEARAKAEAEVCGVMVVKVL